MLKFSFQLCRQQLAMVRCMNSKPLLAKGSLTLRFHEYLNKNPDNNKVAAIFDEVQKLSAKNRDKSLQMLTEKCKSEVKSNEIFDFLEHFVKFMPNEVHNAKFFADSIRKLLEKDEIRNQEFTKLCYLISFFKRNEPGPELLKFLVEKSLDQVLVGGKLTRMDLAVICISTYKTSVRVTNVQFYENIIREVLDSNDDDELIFVAFIKALKMNRVYSTQVIEKLDAVVHEREFDHQSLIHILPYIAEHNSNNRNLISLICEKCIKSFHNQSRAKDVQKLLHSCSLLNLNMDRGILEKLESLVLSRTLTEEFNTHFDHFVNAALSLWILNYHSRPLIDRLFKDRRFYKSGSYDRIKLDSRMKLLRTCVEIEQPKWIVKINSPSSFNASRPAPRYLIRKSLEELMKRELEKKKNAMFVQQISNLNIAGILSTDDSGNIIHYETLDDQTSLSDGKSPNGIFQLKLRLLEKMKCKFQIVK